MQYLKRKFFYPSPLTTNSKTGNRPSSWRVAPYQLFVLFCQSVLCAGQKRNGEKSFFCWWRNHYKKRNAPNPPVKNTASSSSTLSCIMTFHDVYTPPYPPPSWWNQLIAPVETNALRIIRITYSNGVIMVAVAFSGSLFIHTPLRRPPLHAPHHGGFQRGLTCSDVRRESCLRWVMRVNSPLFFWC